MSRQATSNFEKINKKGSRQTSKLTSGTYFVKGAKWWDKIYGNTYNAVKVYKETKTGYEIIVFLNFTYGYGNYYMQRAKEYIEKNKRKNAKIKIIDLGADYTLQRNVKKGWF